MNNHLTVTPFHFNYPRGLWMAPRTRCARGCSIQPKQLLMLIQLADIGASPLFSTSSRLTKLVYNEQQYPATAKILQIQPVKVESAEMATTEWIGSVVLKDSDETLICWCNICQQRLSWVINKSNIFYIKQFVNASIAYLIWLYF